ncbi:MAG: hypothetical protein AB7O96_03860 [Pseudobdellovibrionaceae bacterium]
MKNYKEFLSNRVNQLLIAAILLLIICSLVFSSKDSERIVDGSAQADTYIPAGHVLIPLEISNIDSIKGILGSYGVVDLFRSSEDRKNEPQLIARHVKLIRAPLDPDHFAVLVPETETGPILKGFGPIVAVIQNPKADSSQVFRTQKKTNRIIVGQ